LKEVGAVGEGEVPDTPSTTTIADPPPSPPSPPPPRIKVEVPYSKQGMERILGVRVITTDHPPLNVTVEVSDRRVVVIIIVVAVVGRMKVTSIDVLMIPMGPVVYLL